MRLCRCALAVRHPQVGLARNWLSFRVFVENKGRNWLRFVILVWLRRPFGMEQPFGPQFSSIVGCGMMHYVACALNGGMRGDNILPAAARTLWQCAAFFKFALHSVASGCIRAVIETVWRLGGGCVPFKRTCNAAGDTPVLLVAGRGKSLSKRTALRGAGRASLACPAGNNSREPGRGM